MSVTKPNIAESRFAVDGANADATNFVAPASGARDTGWVLNQAPPSSIANYLQNKAYRWFQFLDEVFKVAGTAIADFKLTGAMAVTGTLTAGGALTVSSGGAAITGNSSVTGTLGVTGAATLGSAAITGAATVGTTLGVTGAATVGGTLGVTGVLTPSGGTSAFTANGLITAAAGVTVPAGQAVTLSGTTTLTTGTGATTHGGTLDVTGLITANGGIGGPLAYTSISPAALSAGNNNNYNPTGLSTAVIVRITTAGGSPFLTGIAGGASGRILYLYNVGADTITITHQDGSSTVANQFITPTGASLSLATNQSMTWLYDATSSKWRLHAKNF